MPNRFEYGSKDLPAKLRNVERNIVIARIGLSNAEKRRNELAIKSAKKHLETLEGKKAILLDMINKQKTSKK